MLDQLLKLDTHLFLWFNSHHSPFWDDVMWFISGRIEWLPLYLVLIAFIIYRFRWKSITILIAVILTIALADQLAVKAFKEVFERLRPTHNPEIQHLVHIVNDYRGGSYGFVSNHAANSFSLAMFISLLFKNRYVTISIFFWALLVSYSRIYLGVHYPGDILGGAVLGMGIGCMIFFGYTKLSERFMNGSLCSGTTKVSK